MKGFFTLISALFLSHFADAGILSGRVLDTQDSLGLPGVFVTVKTSPQKVVVTIGGGGYSVPDLADGTYEVEFKTSGFKTETRTVVMAGGDVVLDVYMNTESKSLRGATVKGQRVTTEATVIADIRKSTLVVSGISSAEIGKTMARTATDVVRRIPGVTIQDDRFITVRGLADRYNTVWLNDAGAPSSEADKKSFSFDIIPSGLIDRILIFKTPSPELPGDFAGGMVKIYTTSIPARNSYTIGLSTAYRSGSTGTDFFYNEPSRTDWLGYDDGQRSLPAIVTGEYVKSTQENNKALSKSFGNDFRLLNKQAPVDMRFNGSASNVFRAGGVKIGTTVGLTYSNVYTNFNVNRLDYDDTAKQVNYNDLQSTNRVNVGVLANVAAVYGNSKIEFKNLYNQIGSAIAVTRTNNPDTFAAMPPNERSYSMGYESRATYSSQLTGTHSNERDTRTYTWALGYTDLYKNQPNLRRIRYTEASPGTGVYRAQIPSGAPDLVNGGGRYYASLFENVYSFSHQLTQKVTIKDFTFDVNAGNYIEYKDRSFEARQFGYTLVPNADNFGMLSLPVGEIFADENVGGPGKFVVNEGTADYDKYSATNQLIASFVSLTLPISTKIKVVGGVRYEDNLYKLQGLINQRPTEPEVHTAFLLPSVNASYNFSTKSLLRMAYGKTINRPEFRETAPFYFYDFDRRAGSYGALYPTAIAPQGDTLDVAEIQNVDVRYELYPSSGELIQIGAFYKHFKNPIQQITYYAGSRAFTTVNATSAYCYGVEVDVRKNLRFLDERFNTGNVFRNLTVVANLALSKSELSIDTTRIYDLLPKSPLEGQSNYVVNGGFFYQSDSAGLQASLLYNVYGSRLYSIGTIDDASIGELPFHSLDLTLTKTFFKHYQLNVGVQNLLDQSYRFVLDGNRDQKFDDSDLSFTKYKPGRYFTVGLRVRF